MLIPRLQNQIPTSDLQSMNIYPLKKKSLHVHFKHRTSSWPRIPPEYLVGRPKRVGVSHNHGFTQTLGNVAIEIVLDPLRLKGGSSVVIRITSISSHPSLKSGLFSRELTYPLPKLAKVAGKMIFLFPRWNMLVPWRVAGYPASLINGRESHHCSRLARDEQ